MQKIILPIIIFTFLFGTVVLAQETDLPAPGLTPDSPLYFFDTLGEKIGMFFTFGAEKKAEKAIKYAEEKLAEVKVMAEKNKIKAIKKANQKYQEFLDLANIKTQEAKKQGKDIEELAVLITEKALRHQQVLSEVYEKVAEEAKTAIEKAIEVSKQGFGKAIKAVSREKKEELQKRLKGVPERLPIYPGGLELKVPSKIKKEAQAKLSKEAEITIYISDDSVQKIKNWYESQMTEKGWKKISEIKPSVSHYVFLWEKGETGLGVVITTGEEPAKDLGIEKEKTVIFLEKDKIETWGKITGIKKEIKKEPEAELKEKEEPEVEKEEKEEITAGEEIFICGDTLVDSRDGKTYATVLIGSQCWMRQGLNVGTRIAGSSGQGTSCSSIQKYCYDDIDANCDSNNNPNYPDGGLYQWNQAMCGSTIAGAQGICPDGWHIPTDAEWCTLEQTIDSSITCDSKGWRGTDGGSKLKPDGSSGFEGNLAGSRRGGGVQGIYWDRNSFGNFWSSTQYSNRYAWYRELGHGGFPGVVRGYYGATASTKVWGFSVRCLKD